MCVCVCELDTHFICVYSVSYPFKSSYETFDMLVELTQKGVTIFRGTFGLKHTQWQVKCIYIKEWEITSGKEIYEREDFTGGNR